LVEGGSCAGTCIGACQLVLTAPAECPGTCIGTCDGECPGGDGEECAGPCAGLCDGECRVPSNGACEGDCTGLCDELVDGATDCDVQLASYCAAGDGAALECEGDCFGGATLEAGEAACRASALALGRALPRCEPPLVQLSFAIVPGGDAAEQARFAASVSALNAPFADLYEQLSRLDLMQQAVTDLLAAAQGEIADRLDAGLEGVVGKDAERCAARMLPVTTAWLEDEAAELDQLHADALMLLAPLTVAE
jgi:hypothetical protein